MFAVECKRHDWIAFKTITAQIENYTILVHNSLFTLVVKFNILFNALRKYVLSNNLISLARLN